MTAARKGNWQEQDDEAGQKVVSSNLGAGKVFFSSEILKAKFYVL